MYPRIYFSAARIAPYSVNTFNLIVDLLKVQFTFRKLHLDFKILVASYLALTVWRGGARCVLFVFRSFVFEQFGKDVRTERYI